MSNIKDLFLRSLEEDIERSVLHIAAGKCKDFEQYLAKVAEINAYKRVKDNFLVAIAKYTEED